MTDTKNSDQTVVLLPSASAVVQKEDEMKIVSLVFWTVMAPIVVVLCNMNQLIAWAVLALYAVALCVLVYQLLQPHTAKAFVAIRLRLALVSIFGPAIIIRVSLGPPFLPLLPVF